MVHVTTTISRTGPDIVSALGQHTAATIHEAQGGTGALDSGIKPIDRDMRFCGSAFTVACHPRDNLMLQVAISYAQPGDVLVVSSGDQPAGQFGDVLGNACLARGIAAVVTDGGVRDTSALRELGVPIFSKFVSIQGTVKESLGPVNQPVVIGGQLVRPGQVIAGDCDGVVLVTGDPASTIDACEARVAAEKEFIRRYHAGETPLTVSNLEGTLADKDMSTDV